MNLRSSAAVVAIAGAAVFGVAACSNSEEPSNATGTTPSVVTETTTTVQKSSLSNDDAQTTLRTAIDPKTSDADLDAVVDTTNPVTKSAVKGFAKGASMAGYTPEVFTVKSVKADGENKAIALVAVKSPHTSEPVDINLTYIKIDDKWKLSSDAVTQLASMAGGR